MIERMRAKRAWEATLPPVNDLSQFDKRMRMMKEMEAKEQVVQVHQDTVDMYLEDTILENLQVVVDKQAREEIQKKAKKLNDVVIAMEESRDSLQSEEITSEMIYGFLIPEPEKIIIQQKGLLKQQKHLQAARRIIEEAAASSSRISPQEPSEQSVSVTKAANQVQEDTASQQVQEKQLDQTD
uniref:Cilia- and flagella-associated protein 91 n=1 Tax=Nothobranchius korthausae TaxID=1143690 RepID=A0A1A8GM50_9TELE